MATFDFVNTPPKECCCSVTSEVLLEPHLTLCCGTHVSKQLADLYKAESRPCPNCNESTLQTVLDKSVQKKVLELKVTCPNGPNGCPWQGSLGELQGSGHLESCEFAPAGCPHNCGVEVTRNTLQAHTERECPNRPATCELCGHCDRFATLALEHVAVCPGYPVSCPNRCGEERIERRLLPLHTLECPMAAVTCDFSSAGCTAKVPKVRMQHHVDSCVTSHLSMVACKQAEIIREIETLKKMTQDKDKGSTDGFRRTTNSEVSELTSRLDQLKEQWREYAEQQSQLVSSLQSSLVEQLETVQNLEIRIQNQEKVHNLSFLSNAIEEIFSLKQQDIITKLEQQVIYLQKAFTQRRDSYAAEQLSNESKLPNGMEHTAAKRGSPDPTLERGAQSKMSTIELKLQAQNQQQLKVSPALLHAEANSSQQPVKATAEPEKPVVPELGVRARMMMYETINVDKQSQLPKATTSAGESAPQSIERQESTKGTARKTSSITKVKPSLLPPVDLIMTDFSERKENNDFWFSDPFYSHQGGYKLCLKVIPGGLGVGTSKNVSVSVYLMKGEFDDSLKWPFRGEIVLQLLDWAKEDVRCEKTISFNDKVDLDVSGRVKDGKAEYGWGDPEFVSHTELASGRAKKIEYMRNDSLKFRVQKIATTSSK